MLTDVDYELLSAYIDGALNQTERTAFELRLLAEPELTRELDEIRATITLLNNLPSLKAPRDFTLDARYARRSSFFFTSATFSALSTAAAIILFALGSYLFIGNNSPPPPASFGQAAQFPLQPSDTDDNLDKAAATTATESDLLNELLVVATPENSPSLDTGLAGSSGLAQESPSAEPAQAIPTVQPLLAVSAQPTGIPLDGFFAGRVPTATGAADDNQRTSEATEASGNQLQDAASSSSSMESNVAPPAPVQETETEANAALSLVVTQPSLTATAAPTSTLLPMATLAPSATYTPLPTATAQSLPTEPPAPTVSLPSPAPDVLPLLLLGLGAVLLITAIVTTIIRRRNRL